jgi:hypothetical protein
MLINTNCSPFSQLTREKRHCPTCIKDVEILNVLPHEDYDEHILSCGHPEGRKNRSIQEEPISITGKLEGEVIKVKTLGSGPVVVSGASEISYLTSGSFQGTINNNGQIINGNYTINNYTYTNTTIESTTTFNNLQDIFTEIDKSNYLPEEKEQVKGALTKIDDVLRSLGGTLDKAAPFAQLLVSILQKL